MAALSYMHTAHKFMLYADADMRAGHAQSAVYNVLVTILMLCFLRLVMHYCSVSYAEPEHAKCAASSVCRRMQVEPVHTLLLCI